MILLLIGLTAGMVLTISLMLLWAFRMSESMNAAARESEEEGGKWLL